MLCECEHTEEQHTGFCTVPGCGCLAFEPAEEGYDPYWVGVGFAFGLLVLAALVGSYDAHCHCLGIVQ